MNSIPADDGSTEVLAYDADGDPITRGEYEGWEQSDCRDCGAANLDGYAVTDDRDDVLCYDCLGVKDNA